ncbi:MAG: nucleoside triphosphate pyrophosphatase [Corynebacterium sp.]|uniref:Maf family protein n=1 Tax=Corynebacterium sp. TaxID=1720 RepID=UPI0026DBB4D4|nr:nucleoside triphosphate pyrophosphatase [Corynebacterium sp.]MDO5097649.1 nucleoside triphosphate pyrophosphatase [Corynebacterium sp.]
MTTAYQSDSPRIVLASSSPSRLSILQSAGVDPIIAPADVDEDALLSGLAHADPEQVVVALAAAKAAAVAPQFPTDVVIGADSMLLLDGKLQGKPHTVEETIYRWQAQRGKKATLITGHCLVSPRGEFQAASATAVHFADVTDADIAAYAATGEPLPCAGAFTLEAIGGWFIDRIDGDPSSVIGLSLPVLRQGLYHFGYQVHEFWNTANAAPVK